MFATRGISAVGLREVAVEAGQRNTAAVHYHFGTKDDLLRELLVDGARAIDVHRQAIIDRAEASGTPSMDELVCAFVQPSLDLESAPGHPETYHRFLSNIMGERRELFESTIVDSHATGYQRATAHVRRLLDDVAPAEIDRRIVFATLSLQAIFTARETACDAMPAGTHPFWGRRDVTRGIFATTEAILLQR
ncbi:helix-turn-helix domain-containing protein [Sphingomonas adhaesiva]